MKKLTAIAFALMLVATVFVFAACTPSSSAKMKERYEKENYSVTVLISESDSASSCSWQLTAMPKSTSILGGLTSLGNIVSVTCYNNKEDAQAAYDKLADVSEDCKFISGKIVVTGFSKEAVDIAR